MAAVVCGELPKGPDDVVLSCNPTPTPTPQRIDTWIRSRLPTDHCKPIPPPCGPPLRIPSIPPAATPIPLCHTVLHPAYIAGSGRVCSEASCLSRHRHDLKEIRLRERRLSPVCGQLFVTHHELQVVDDHVTYIIHVDRVLHCVNHRPGRRNR